jgi:hypothetical protein
MTEALMAIFAIATPGRNIPQLLIGCYYRLTHHDDDGYSPTQDSRVLLSKSPTNSFVPKHEIQGIAIFFLTSRGMPENSTIFAFTATPIIVR